MDRVLDCKIQIKLQTKKVELLDNRKLYVRNINYFSSAKVITNNNFRYTYLKHDNKFAINHNNVDKCLAQSVNY